MDPFIMKTQPLERKMDKTNFRISLEFLFFVFSVLKSAKQS
jgi:hypothetical protein